MSYDELLYTLKDDVEYAKPVIVDIMGKPHLKILYRGSFCKKEDLYENLYESMNDRIFEVKKTEYSDDTLTIWGSYLKYDYDTNNEIVESIRINLNINDSMKIRDIRIEIER